MQFARLNGIVIHHQVIWCGSGPADHRVSPIHWEPTIRIWRDVIVRLAGDFPGIIAI